jgi:hypothetical protein
VKKANSDIEKSTLGDLEVLSQLKEQMDEASSKPEPKKKATKKADSEEGEKTESAE